MDKHTSRRTFLQTASIGLGGAFALSPLAHAQSGEKSDLQFTSHGVPQRLKILVLGGTGQTGPHFVRRARAHGHEITLFNRGNRSAEMFPDIECIIGDRAPEKADGLDALKDAVKEGRTWDVVIDIWPHIPKIVEATAELLKKSTKRYMFVSSLSVYADNAEKYQDETSAVGEAPDADNTEFNWELFGPFKAECENRVRRIYPNAHTIYRPGLIIGPRDFSFRGGYWPVRIRQGGEVLAPGDGTTLIQNIDARDLVAFELICMERVINGTFNVVGPHPNHPMTMKRLLETCKQVSNSDSEFTWVPGDFLAANGVGPWMQMPNWLPTDGEYAGFGTRKVDKAVVAGLTFRPLSETIEDTLQWYDSLTDERRDGLHKRAGISAEKEAEVLQAWKEKVGEGEE